MIIKIKKIKLSQIIFPALLISIIFSQGCSLFDGSIYDTFHVSTDELREIEPVDLGNMVKKESPVEKAKPVKEEKPPEELVLTIDKCRYIALENNLDLDVQMFNPLISEESVTEAKAAFEPVAFSTFNYAKISTPTALTLEANKSEAINADAGVTIPLHTGGDITIDFPFNRTKTDNKFAIMDPFFSTDFSVRVNQPLLRGGGFRANTHGIRIARYNLQKSLAQCRLEVIRVLADVDRVYWRLYASRRDLLVKKQEYDLAVEQLESAKRKLKVKQVAEIEVFRAEEAAAERIEAIIIAENLVRDRERELKQVLNKSGMDMESPTKLIIGTEPNSLHYKLDRKLLLNYALKHRMELLELELQLASDKSTIDYLENASWPFLSLNYTYNINALGPSARDSYDLLFEDRFADHRVGASFQIPLGNQAARSRVRAAMRQRQLTLATRKRRVSLIKREVLAAADQMDANWQRIVASKKNSILAKRTLEEETNRFKIGLQNSIEVLNAQVRFARAKSAEIQALVEYQISQVDLAYATGSLLGADRIEWDYKKKQAE